MKRHSHWMGWCALVGIVIAADVYGDDTMSSAFRKLARHPVAGPVMYGVWAGLTAHLFLSADNDPAHIIVRQMSNALRPAQMSVFDFTDDDTFNA